MSREAVVAKAKAEAIANGMTEEAAAKFAESLAGSDELKSVVRKSELEDVIGQRDQAKEAARELAEAKEKLAEYEKQGKSDLELERAKVSELEEKVAKLPELEKQAAEAEADRKAVEELYEAETKDFSDTQKALIPENLSPREKLKQARLIKEALGKTVQASAGQRGATFEGGSTITKEQLANIPSGAEHERTMTQIREGKLRVVD